MSNRLPVLQAAARDAHEAVGRNLQAAAERALEAGAALVEAKDLCPYGGWATWLVETGISARSASRYMTLARSGITSAIVAELGLNRAERYAVAGNRMIPPAGQAVWATGVNDDGLFGSVSVWWADNDRLAYLQATLPDGILVQPRRGPVPPWIAALLHEGTREKFDLYEEKTIPITEAMAFVAEMGAAA